MNRIIQHPILGDFGDRTRIFFQFDGIRYEAYENETIAAALLANGIRKLRVHEDSGTPRGVYCNIGHCLECRVTVNEQSNVRACLTLVEKDMVIESGKQHPNIVRRMVEKP
ncbi:(2Fe-2S)-binding protein (plasmid) [Priestia megaterium]|uniref:2Fe-2S iron-sulfur cluster binding domain protein n=1 Tax=Priestia megaterium (strain ATCC 14581 / DSM 32 / CCUG 1817 / JCM 2506 / NBRC 15308 / NCIMB 9376 / NCTC 10342 / NRRL B-14308 / VKM B-512 / Ford 19) TaxID=1348623 RepID=A0A0B6AQU9_PRIM2|nr:(2Fe-2S)-binding protein [Priestia megaterium]MBK0009674.1 (2Fe-2S)-binding protein [Bacillus sp. S35]AJI25816.1 2Fe-2S iron-sulfur cluster binding domain protein [Priestia megaterium NBRC 15308 = ATCC 14581]KFN07887.1 2Fe-2S iron-sulfur cluster binding domain protein [Priestia megaterium]KGJ74408.1 (2Fe-2S)-binding protein [Priestia megaterium NBRC 15308 = ATCC 14581]MBU8757527.1 (2Fe-2S)-binding protein [Priestia megaterium]